MNATRMIGEGGGRELLSAVASRRTVAAADESYRLSVTGHFCAFIF